MNRLILIGNGFDLAHGLKTGYNQFILWYIKQALTVALTSDYYSDALFTVKVNPRVYRGFLKQSQVHSGIDSLYEQDCLFHLLDNVAMVVDDMYSGTDAMFVVSTKSRLLDALLRRCGVSLWVEIENEFYKELKVVLGLKEGARETPLKELNDSLECLIMHLNTYLSSLEPSAILPAYNNIFNSDIKVGDLIDSKLGGDMPPRRTMILNFNYTNTVEGYLSSLRSDVTVNHIHGRIMERKNPIVFGFGDELDSIYKEMEHQSLNGFFRYTKSFWYLDAMNYRNLLMFINNTPYEIVILGHSCGLSDRTLLNMIFEHANCKSVRIYYHGTEETNNYKEILYQLGRQFNDKLVMRSKIVPSPLCKPMPQYNDVS